jgi:hypothetical protein
MRVYYAQSYEFDIPIKLKLIYALKGEKMFAF